MKPEVWFESGAWYHRDETDSIYGPFPSEDAARVSLQDSIDELEGRRPLIPPALAALLDTIWTLEDEIANEDVALKNKKEFFRKLVESELTEMLTDRELRNGVRFPDGQEFTFAVDMHCSIPKDRKAEAFAYLAERGADAMLKRNVTIAFGKDSVAVVKEFRDALARLLPSYEVSVRAGKAPELLVVALKEILRQAGLNPVVTEELTLDGSTLRSWVLKNMKLGQPIPDCFGVYAPMKAVAVAATPVTDGSPVATS